MLVISFVSSSGEVENDVIIEEILSDSNNKEDLDLAESARRGYGGRFRGGFGGGRGFGGYRGFYGGRGYRRFGGYGGVYPVPIPVPVAVGYPVYDYYG